MYQIERVLHPIGERLVALEQQAQACQWSAESFGAILRNRGYLWCAMKDHAHCLGYLLLQDQTDLYEVMQLTVLPDYRQQGIGGALLQAAIDHVSTEQAEGIFLEVRASNQQAVALYQQRGFIEVGKRKGYYSTHNAGREDAILMRLLCHVIKKSID